MYRMALKSKVLILTYGTRGDVEPFIALAQGLSARGHEVTLCTAARFGPWIEDLGVPFMPMSDASLDLMDTPDGKRMLEGASGRLGRIAAAVRLARKSGPINAVLNRDAWLAARQCAPDLIIFHPKVMAAPHIAEALRVPAIMGLLQPMIVPTAAFPPTGLPELPIPFYNRLAYRLVRASYAAFRKSMNSFRTEDLGLAPLSRGQDVLRPPGADITKILHAISPHVLPRPEDWPSSAIITGYWFLDTADRYAPPDDLAHFLASGPPPVYVGFGSMVSEDARSLLQVTTEALNEAGARGVIGSGWAGLQADTGEDILIIPPVPHEWLFPKMAAVVHHGGAGTTAQGFRAGVPCVICPFIGDQPGWARKAVALGVGATPVPRRALTAHRLAQSIRMAMTDPDLRRNAEILARDLHEEDGVARAVAEIEECLPAADADRRSLPA